MENTEKLIVQILADTSGLQKEFGKVQGGIDELGRNTKGATETMNRSFAETQKKMKSFGDSMGKVGRNLTVGLTLPLMGIAAAGINYASDLKEVQNVVDVAFGDSAGVVNEWSKTTLAAYGISELGSKKYAGTVKSMTKAMGLTEQASNDMAFGITGLTGDMASFYNLDGEEMFTKLRGGLTGEYEGLKALGIVLNEAKVETYAYATGMAEAGAELTDAQKVTARYELILQQTNDAQGDFNRTSDSFANQMKVVKGRLQETAGQLMEALLPALENVLTKVQKAIDWFAALDEGQKKNILTFAAVAAALGPVLMIFGKLVSMASGITSIVTAISGVGAAAGTAAGAAGVGGLGVSLGGFAVAAAPFVAGAAVVGAAGYAIYKTLSEDVIPEVDLFADHISYASETVTDEFGNVTSVVTDASVIISEETKAQVGSFMELDEGARIALTELYMGATELTGQGWTDIRTALTAGIDMILGDMEKFKDDDVAILGELFEESENLTVEEMAAIRKLHEEDFAEKEKALEGSNARIQEIMDAAHRENRNVTKSEQAEINRLLDEAQEIGVDTYATSEAEKNVILNRLAASQERITAQMISDTIKELNGQRDETVRIAAEQRDEQVRLAEETRAMGGAEAEDLADKMIEEANRQYDEVVDKAEGIRDDGVSKIKGAYGDLANSVDSDTGEILTAWDKVKNWWDSWFPKNKTTTITTNQQTVYSSRKATDTSMAYGASRNAAGSNYFKGGLTSINEVGGEIIDLPRGSRIIPHDISEKMAENSSKQTVINFNGNYNFRDKEDMDYFMNQFALANRRI